MSWSLLERFFESELFNNDPSLAVAYLSRYSQKNHIGIQYTLCNKLRQFAYEEIEFFLPQLCHLLVSIDNESMALEEFIVDLCQESVSGALLTFWLFQTHLHDLSSAPQSIHFKTCRRIFNKVQKIVFGTYSASETEKIQENVLPTSVLASFVLAGVAAPFLPRNLGPLAIAQARKPRPTEDTISETPQVQGRIVRSKTVSGTSAPLPKPRKSSHHTRSTSAAFSGPLLDGLTRSNTLKPSRRPNHMDAPLRPSPFPRLSSSPLAHSAEPRLSSSSLPDPVRIPSPALGIPSKLTNARIPHGFPLQLQRSHSSRAEPSTLPAMTRNEKVHMLRSNYFKSETQFLSALEGISNRLVIVPKQARLSALRAELALVARDLPAEVDIPLLCPAVLDGGSPSKSRHHRVVRINPAEATSLNSAERVPYLLMIEVLREDFDFNPDSDANQRVLATLIYQKESNKRRLFDITPAARASIEHNPPTPSDSVFEPTTGDLSSPDLLAELGMFGQARSASGTNVQNGLPEHKSLPERSSTGAHTMSSYSVISTPRTSDVPNSRSGSPGPNNWSMPGGSRTQAMDQQDFSALATHMRTAAQMLAQLDVSSSKRPKVEVEAIKGRIIASMQTLEEQNFINEDTRHPSSFDTLMASVRSDSVDSRIPEADDSLESVADPTSSTGAGAARMENDQKTGGVQRKGDRDDPSAATFGEEWRHKKERIRRSSPYGWMSNWDLLSVIVKTGSDLRQEMFACQLIRICSKVWEDDGVPIWTKQMRILVTGESSGLIETIANGLSVHSLKRSLTLSTIAAGTNPRKRIATLKDHFVRTFGDVGSTGYRAALDAFVRSLAAYSMLSYVLQLKDRHNGNILIDNVGHIIHIDFGFMLSNSPGSVGFEAAPFKLTQEYVDVLGGPESADFVAFKALCKQAFQALRKSAEHIVSVVDMMGKESKMACFASGGPAYVTSSLRQRFCLQLSREEAEGFVDELVAKSLGSYYTRLYDTFQYRTQGIY